MSIIEFLGSNPGRWVRGIIGVVLGAIAIIAGQWWLLLLVPAALFLAAAVFDFCVLGPLVRLPLRGSAFRGPCARPSGS